MFVSLATKVLVKSEISGCKIFNVYGWGYYYEGIPSNNNEVRYEGTFEGTFEGSYNKALPLLPMHAHVNSMHVWVK